MNRYVVSEIPPAHKQFALFKLVLRSNFVANKPIQCSDLANTLKPCATMIRLDELLTTNKTQAASKNTQKSPINGTAYLRAFRVHPFTTVEMAQPKGEPKNSVLYYTRTLERCDIILVTYDDGIHNMYSEGQLRDLVQEKNAVNTKKHMVFEMKNRKTAKGVEAPNAPNALIVHSGYSGLQKVDKSVFEYKVEGWHTVLLKSGYGAQAFFVCQMHFGKKRLSGALDEGKQTQKRVKLS